MRRHALGAILAVIFTLAAVSFDSAAPAPLSGKLLVCVAPGKSPRIIKTTADCTGSGAVVQRFALEKTLESTHTSQNRETKSSPSSRTTRSLPQPRTDLASLPLILPDTSPGCDVGWNRHFFVGDSFNDFNFLSTANCSAGAAKGAQASFARDGIAPNTQWSVKGAIAEEFIWERPIPDQRPTTPYVALLAFAPVVSFQRVTNTNMALARQDVDVLTYGLSAEAFIDNLGSYWQAYLRVRATVNSDFEGRTHSWSTTAEVQPLHPAFEHIVLPGIGYIIVQPLIRAQFFQQEFGTPDPIFARASEVARGGPFVSVSLVPAPAVNVPPGNKIPAYQWVLNFSYSYYHDFISNLNYSLLNPTFTYNFSDNIGASLSYQRGQIEQTGKPIDLMTAGLSVKF